MKGFEESRNDIQRLAAAFKKEPAFKFNENELTYFERLYRILDPKPKAKNHMKSAMEYLSKHVCESASSLKPKPKDFEFDFDWDCENFHSVERKGQNCLSEV